jgi:hypothetical protein
LVHLNADVSTAIPNESEPERHGSALAWGFFEIMPMHRLLLIVAATVLLGGTAEAQNSYSTNFPLTENPISEGGRWINGASVGLDWKNCQTTPGLAFGTQSGAQPPPYDDSTCVLSGTWGRVQSAEATLVVPATPTGSQEVEIRLLTSITPHRHTGYEVLFSVTDNTYIDIVRWDTLEGPSTWDEFHFIVRGVIGPRLATGNRIRGTVDANGVIRAYLDTGSGFVLMAEGTDTTYTTGAPGLGFYTRGSGNNASFGVSSFSASSGPTPPAPPTSLRIIRAAAEMDGVLPYLPLFLRRRFASDADPGSHSAGGHQGLEYRVNTNVLPEAYARDRHSDPTFAMGWSRGS